MPRNSRRSPPPRPILVAFSCLLLALAPANLPRLESVSVSLPVLGFAFLLSTAVAAGLSLETERDIDPELKRRQGGYGPGAWCLPGGKIDYGETMQEAAGRLQLSVRTVEVDAQGRAPDGTAVDLPEGQALLVEIFETDILARTAVHYLESVVGQAGSAGRPLTLDKLRQGGFA